MGRVVYIPEKDNVWTNYFVTQARQTGHGMDGFQGIPYQRGYGLGSFFGHLFRTILPVAKRIGKTVGKEALAMGANVASDLVQGRNARESLEEHGRQAAANLMNKASSHIRKNQSGSGLQKRSVSSKTIAIEKPKKRRRVSKKKKKPDFFSY